MDEYTWAQWWYYHRFNVQNILLGLFVLGQFLYLAYKVWRNKKEDEHRESDNRDDDTSVWSGGNRVGFVIKDCDVDCGECANNANNRIRDSLKRDSER